MDKVFEIYKINPLNEISGWIAFVFGLLATIITASLTIPQLVEIVKTKKIHPETKYYQYWIFFVALIGWMVYGAFQNLIASFIANIICLYIYSVYMYFLYKYRPLRVSEAEKNEKAKVLHKKRERNAIIVIAITLTLSSAFLIVAILKLALPFNVSEELNKVLAQIVPMLSVFAFLPQIIRNFETKRFNTISTPMVTIFVVNNVVWIIYFFFIGYNQGSLSDLISPITWQALSLMLYSSQLAMITKYHRVEKKQKTQNVSN
ncbi:PQ-loop domain-containing transporter [Mycoplasmopsis columbinasalis]|uniref:PQ loop repeat n=1 Tax=Mycoplasmopsis columbinasalis TaxID=114880 RepID=A0A449BAB9_9BACT|nr:PQ-loop domain-containing transporter [Mycoplasmopsis columbinasalis]VEU78150.1 PQ loop repeat [Mycoplasmopsis columbinasalis]